MQQYRELHSFYEQLAIYIYSSRYEEVALNVCQLQKKSLFGRMP